MRNLSEIQVMIRALKLYINVHNFVYETSEGAGGVVCDYLKAADMLRELKQKEKDMIDALANEQECM